MFHPLFAAGIRLWHNDLWYAMPAIAAVSLVYAATRHERMRPIWLHAAKFAGWTVLFMFIASILLEYLAWLT